MHLIYIYSSALINDILVADTNTDHRKYYQISQTVRYISSPYAPETGDFIVLNLYKLKYTHR